MRARNLLKSGRLHPIHRVITRYKRVGRFFTIDQALPSLILPACHLVNVHADDLVSIAGCCPFSNPSVYSSFQVFVRNAVFVFKAEDEEGERVNVSGLDGRWKGLLKRLTGRY